MIEQQVLGFVSAVWQPGSLLVFDSVFDTNGPPDFAFSALSQDWLTEPYRGQVELSEASHCR